MSILTGSTFSSVSKGKGLENWLVKASPQHKWYYLRNQTPDEVMFVKCFDSKLDGRVRRAPHSSFEDPRTKDEQKARQSIEVRCLVFWENESAE